GSGRLAGDPRQLAGDSDRGVADLRHAAVSAGAGGPYPRAQARRGGLSESGRDGGDAGRWLGAALRRCRRGDARARTGVRDAGCRLGAIGPRRRSRAPRERVVPPGGGSAARRGLGALWGGAAPARGRAAAAAGRGGGEETVAFAGSLWLERRQVASLRSGQALRSARVPRAALGLLPSSFSISPHVSERACHPEGRRPEGPAF